MQSNHVTITYKEGINPAMCGCLLLYHECFPIVTVLYELFRVALLIQILLVLQKGFLRSSSFRAEGRSALFVFEDSFETFLRLCVSILPSLLVSFQGYGWSQRNPIQSHPPVTRNASSEFIICSRKCTSYRSTSNISRSVHDFSTACFKVFRPE